MSIKYHNIEEYIVHEYEKSNIYIIENILTDDFCDKMRDLINTVPTEKHTFRTGNNVKCYTTDIEKLMKMNDELHYKFSTENDNQKITDMVKKKDIYTNEINGVTISELKQYSNEIDNIMAKLNKTLSLFNIKIDATSGYIIRKIYGETRLHSDGITDTVERTNLHFFKDNQVGDISLVRCASIVFSLNNDYDGGEFVFPKHDITIKLKKGSVLVFPPFWTHEHGTNPLLNNTYRYTITTWGCQHFYPLGK